MTQEDKRIIQIPYNYTPYNHQIALFKARDQGIRHLFTRWHRRCFIGETPIAMSDGTWKNIKDIEVGDKVLSYNYNHVLETKKVLELFYNGEQEVTEYNDITCTPNHKVLTVHGSYKEIDKTNHLINSYNLAFGDIHNPELAELLGYLLTDGHIKINQTPKFTNTSSDLLNRFEYLVKKEFNIIPKWYKKGNGFDLVCSTKNKTNYHPIRKYFETSNTMPEIIWKMDKESTLAFLSGVISGDGSLYYNETITPKGYKSFTGQLVIEAGISEDLAKDYKKLLLKFGIRSKIKKDKRGNNWRVYIYSLKLLWNISGIKLYHPDKNARLAHILLNVKPRNYLRQEKIKIGESYLAKTYDITIEDNHSYIANGYIVHNSGKDKSYWNLFIREAAKRKGSYFYFWPELKQARDSMWEAMDNDGFKFLDHIPPELRSREPNNQDMKVELSNGSIIKLQGTDKFENRRGANPIGIVYTEFAYQNPNVRKAMNPIIKANGGWEAINSTPNGKNHMYHLEQSINKVIGEDIDINRRWFLDVKTMDETFRHDGTPIFTKEDYEDERREGNSEEFLQQEYYVSYQANAQGYYYLAYMNQARDNGKIGNFPWIPDLPVNTYWDIGVGDSTAIWFMQWVNQTPRIIDFYQNFSAGLDHYGSILLNGKRAKYAYKRHVFPHDIANTEFGTGKSRYEVAEGIFGAEKCDIGPKLGFEDGIQAVRVFIPRCEINECEDTEKGIDALENYQRQYDETKKEFSPNPVRNWCTHPADALRYMAVDAEAPRSKSRLAERLRKYRRQFGKSSWKVA